MCTAMDSSMKSIFVRAIQTHNRAPLLICQLSIIGTIAHLYTIVLMYIL